MAEARFFLARLDLQSFINCYREREPVGAPSTQASQESGRQGTCHCPYQIPNCFL
jgi:hypothetical protein